MSNLIANEASQTEVEDWRADRTRAFGQVRQCETEILPERIEIIDFDPGKSAIRQKPSRENQPEEGDVISRQKIGQISTFEGIVGSSSALRAVLSRLSKVATTDSTVLITGETGTGKELIARAIHRRSTRSAGPFIKVNCAAIPQSLIASELFGHERGAFTGALQRKLGRFELAQGGTLFLDEVGELPLQTQIALLRVIQEREFERMGGTRPIRANIRLITATNRNLEAEVSKGAFRSDLYYRLNVFPIEMPPLRARKQDLLTLIEHFIRRYAAEMSRHISCISRRSLELLESYSWPGNIRELQNLIERSLILCETDTFAVDSSWLAQLPADIGAHHQPLTRRLLANEKRIIEAVLAETRGRVSGADGAALKLGLPASTLESKIRALNINKHVFKFPSADWHGSSNGARISACH